MQSRIVAHLFTWTLIGLLLGFAPGFAQNVAPNAALRGVVTDTSGASVPKATVTISGPDGAEKTADADANGAYRFVGLAPGDYSVVAAAPQLTLPAPVRITLTGGVQVLNLQLKVETVVQTVNVQEDAPPTVSTDATNNASAVVLKGEDLASIADSPEDMLSDLQALAGPSAGPSGGSVYVDGFSNGDLPAKESIREIRINQNPFSPEYDKLGYGRIEILTKPGADRFRGNLNYNLGDDVWNARNPYSAEKAPMLLNEWENTISGPLGKRASFSLDANQNNVDNGAIINAVALDPQSLTAAPFFQNFKVIQKRTRLYPRIDYQLNPNITLAFQYSFTHGDIDGSGIGGFDLTSRGFRLPFTTHTVQAMETIVSGPAIIDLRFRYYHNANRLVPDSLNPEVQVLGSFNSGGSTQGASADTSDSLESHNDASVLHGTHLLKFGIRAREQFDNNISPVNFNGTFTFSGGTAPLLDANNQPVLDASGQPVMTATSSIEQYRRTLLFQGQGLPASQIRALGGGATQFSIFTGIPSLSMRQFDVAVYSGDDWKIRPNLTLSYGLRYEIQTNMSDPHDFAPRLALAWAPGANARTAKANTVLRAGFGIFYDRVALANFMTAARYNGVVQQQYVINSPDFYPLVPSGQTLAALSSSSNSVIQTIAPDLRGSGVMQTALSMERQLPKGTTLAVTYTNAYSTSILRSQDINAPIQGTYSPADPGATQYPLGHPGAVLQMQSNGRYNQNQLITNVTAKINAAISLNGSYVLNRSMSNSDGVGTFPGDPYSMQGEYGPAFNDIRQRVSLAASINTKWNVRISPLLNLQSGAPFNIVTGNDLYGTTLLNSRPGIATNPNLPGLVQTSYGLLDPNPTPGEQIIGRNAGRGPGQIMMNLRIAKTIELGPRRESATKASGGGFFSTPASTRRYSLNVSASIRNILNHTNPGPIIGNITSPLFGLANQMAGGANGEGFSENANNRRSELQLRFTF